MRITIEIDGTGTDAVRVLNAAVPAAGQPAATDTPWAASTAQLTATNAGPAPGQGGQSAESTPVPGMPASGGDLPAGVSAGAAPNAP